MVGCVVGGMFPARPEAAPYRSIEIDVGVVVGRCAAAEEAEFCLCGDLVAGASRDEDGVAGTHGTGFAVDFHLRGSLEEEVEFFEELVVVAVGGLAGGHAGFGQALFFDGGVGAVEDTADGRAVLRGEGALIFELLDYHEGEDMRFFEGCTALITGASSGLGEEFARELAPVAEKLVLVARRGEHLDALKTDLEARHANVRVFVYVMDLTRENQTRDFVEWLEREKIRINFLVNNAGMGDRGPFATGDWTKIHDMLELNIVALTRLTHHLLPMLLEGGRGAVLNVSSIAGLIPLPHMSVYAATKAYVNSFSDGLRMELRDTGISVTAVLPGPVETEFGQVASRGTGEPEWKTPDDLTLPAAEVVRSALSAVAADKARVIPGWKLVLLMGIAVALPLGLLRAVLQRKAR